MTSVFSWQPLRTGSSQDRYKSVRNGALAGLAGGLLMLATAAVVVGVQGFDIWFQAKALSSLVLGSAAVANPGFALGAVALGVLLHLVFSAVLGAAYGFFVEDVARLPSDLGVPAVTGLVFGLVLWLLAYFVVAPALNPLLLVVYAPALIVQHIVFGTATGMFFGVLQPRPFAQLAAQA